MRKPKLRRGMTLVELLVVITILVIMIGLAIPIMRPNLRDRGLREASRQLNTYVTLAKARAAEKRRPVGLYIKRDPTFPNTAYQIYLAETPLPYSGQTQDERADLRDMDNDGFADTATISDPSNLVQAGDLIQFDYKGPLYRIISASGGVLTFTPEDTSTRRPLPNPKTIAPGSGARYQVFRQPVRSGTNPLELPNGIVIDLQFSGVGATGNEMASATGDIVIMFEPNGSVSRVYGFSPAQLGTIHLLVGRLEQTSDLNGAPTTANLIDPTNSWVSIGHQTGTVTTAENYVVDPVTMASAQLTDQLREARSIAQSKQTRGGL